MNAPTWNWRQKGWPKALKAPQDMEVVARALTDEAVKTSAIEGVNVDESVVMSSICKALGVTYAPKGFTKDARAEGVAQMMLAVRESWNAPLSAKLLTGFHGALMAGEEKRVAVGAFRSHKEPMRVVRRLADGTVEIRYEAPPSANVSKEIAAFVRIWKQSVTAPADIAIKAAMLHPHFESIHPFEDGNGRVGRALVAKTIETWDAGYYQICKALKEVGLASEEFAALKQAHDALRAKLLPKVYEYGFLNPDVEVFE